MNEEIVNCFNIVIEVVKGVALYVMPIAAFIVSLIALKRSNDLESYKYYFYSMPLLASCIRYDLTGEKVNPSIFYNSSMRELKTLEAASGMEDFHEKMISTNDELVEKYGLPKKFIWKE